MKYFLVIWLNQLFIMKVIDINSIICAMRSSTDMDSSSHSSEENWIYRICLLLCAYSLFPPDLLSTCHLSFSTLESIWSLAREVKVSLQFYSTIYLPIFCYRKLFLWFLLVKVPIGFGLLKFSNIDFSYYLFLNALSFVKLLFVTPYRIYLTDTTQCALTLVLGAWLI